VSQKIAMNDFDGLRPRTSGLGKKHEEWRATLRIFVDEHIAPDLDAWSEAGTFPDEIYKKAAKAGLLGFGFSAELGGWTEDVDLYHRIIFAEEFHRHGSGVVFADIATLWIGLPPVAKFGSPQLLESVVRPVLAGEKKIAFAVTEPGGGSDVAGLSMSADFDGDHYVVNGAKTLISGATRANWILTVVRTGSKGLTLLLIDSASEGIAVEPVRGLSWYSASNGTISFDSVKVPVTNRLGDEGRAFSYLTEQFNIERFSGVAATLAMARTAAADAIAWAKDRHTFGKRLIDHQSIRHKLVAMVREIRAAYGYLDQCVYRFENNELPIADLCMLKFHATGVLERVSRDAMHVLGGQAYQGNHRIERIQRESRIFALGGGTEEVLSDLAARQLEF
jgi:acyl-CoA dehydrogenase|tara:strand:- start:20636 stop:21811 length:1176 start_codon:yes stop_codon:yes gene_type:complete